MLFSTQAFGFALLFAIVAGAAVVPVGNLHKRTQAQGIVTADNFDDWNHFAQIGYSFAYIEATNGSSQHDSSLHSSWGTLTHIRSQVVRAIISLGLTLRPGMLAYFVALSTFPPITRNLLALFMPRTFSRTVGAVTGSMRIPSQVLSGSKVGITHLQFPRSANSPIVYPVVGGDCELSTGDTVQWIHDFSDFYASEMGHPPVIQVNADWWGRCTGGSTEFSANPLWLAAEPGNDEEVGPLPAGWNQYAFAHATGGPVFNGALADLQQ